MPLPSNNWSVVQASVDGVFSIVKKEDIAFLLDEGTGKL
jgi:hypothetical protein